MDRRETWFSNRRFGVVLAGVLVLAGCAGSPPAAPPLPPPGTAFRDCAACPEMMVVPAGTYLMGSPPGEKDRDADEGPRHRVTFAAPFALARHALTRRQFAAFVQATGQRTEGGCETWNGTRWASDPAVSWRDPGYDQGPEHPVVCISWVDARSYVGWLRAKTGRPYRLPSEAEWEYASRAGDDGPAPWSSMPERACALANVHDRTGARAIASDWEHYDCDDGHPRTSPVGAFPANPFGLFDVLGNVWEWQEDCYRPTYDGAPSDGSAWADGPACRRRVLRGGAWNSRPKYVRHAFRLRVAPARRLDIYGLRPALGPKP